MVATISASKGSLLVERVCMCRILSRGPQIRVCILLSICSIKINGHLFLLFIIIIVKSALSFFLAIRIDNNNIIML